MANQERKNRRRKAKAKKKAERGKVTVKQEKAEDDGSEEANLDHDNDDGECLVSFAVFYFGLCGCKCPFVIIPFAAEGPLFGAAEVGYPPHRWKR